MTTIEHETPDATSDPKELARHLMIAAARFAAASIQAYSTAYPDQAALLMQPGASFGVRVTDLLSTNPRVALVNQFDGEEVEVAHVLLAQPGAPNLRRMN